MHADDLALLHNEPHNHLYAIVANGGAAVNARMGATMATDVLGSLENFGDKQTVLVFTVAPADPDYGRIGAMGNRYAPPFVVGIQVTDPVARTGMRDQGWFTKDHIRAYYLLGAKDMCVPWMGPIYSVSGGAGTDACAISCRAALREHIWFSPVLGHMLAQYTPHD
jgi:hypothetical protein